MLLKELFEESGKHISFCFGRMNPPTIGHGQLLDTVAAQGGDYKIFVSQSQDTKKNPLDYATKVQFIKKMFPKHAKNVVEDAGLNTIVKVASYLYDQGYRHATFVAGSDRLEDMKKLLEAYNGVEGKSHGFYDFKTLDFESSGDREDGAEGVAGISASGARAAAANGDLNAFAEATGAGKYAEELYNAVRKGMGISEGLDEMKAKEFIPVSKPRNFVVKNQKTAGAGKHKDKKKAAKQGQVKHKGQMAEGIGGTIVGGVGQFFGNKIDPLAGEIMRAHGEIAGRKAEYTIRKYMHLLQKALKQQLDSGDGNNEDMQEASDFGEPREILEDVLQTLEREVEWPLTDVMDPREVKQLLAPIVKAVNDKMMSMEEGRRDYGYDDFGNSLRPGSDEGSTEPPNNFAIYINGKKWKVFQGRGQYADDQYEMQQFRQLQAMTARKSQETGKKWEVARTGEPATK